MQELITDRTILVALTGSRAYGMEREDSDWDYRTITVPKTDEYLRIRNNPSVQVAKDETLDLVHYDLRRFVELALKLNPTILELLWRPPVYANERGLALLKIRRHLHCVQIRNTYGGYGVAQIRKCRNALIGEKNSGIKAKNPYKHAAHCYRILQSGLEYLESGELRVDRTNLDADYLKRIVAGDEDIYDVLDQAEQILKSYDKVKYSSIPERSDIEAVNKIYLSLLDSFVGWSPL